MSGEAAEITVGAYLCKRLHEFGVRGVHGYAADGYARIKGMSALITTFGVGELSALAAVAGSYSEHVPVVHIVGVPNTASQKQQLLLHHTLGNGDFRVFSDMSKSISETFCTLNEAADYVKEIDRVLRTCWVRARPVYIALPTNTVFQKVDGSRLKKPIPFELDLNPEDVEQEVVDQILDLMYKSQNTVILADACSIRHRVLDELHQLVMKTNLPTFVTPMGKGAVNETLGSFGGVYVGDVSRKDVKETVEGADLVLFVGGLVTDFNSGGFTFHIPRNKTVRYAEFPGITMKYVMQRLVNQIDMSKIKVTPTTIIDNILPMRERQSMTQDITHAWMWPTLGQWLREKDVVITETGTAIFGLLETRFPADVTAISQVLWGSIGYSVGALQGAALAVHEQKVERRVILFVGEGSLQLSAQEISTIIRHGLTPIIFVLNNDGYSSERKIHGAEAKYNDIHEWKYTKLLDLFNANPEKSKTYQVRTKTEMEKLLMNKSFATGKYIELVEVFMPKQDAPRALEVTAQNTARLNKVLNV
ncbi:pyruvate decarboxylase [Terfezia boudieri ATCC MYA-4762]|uniref:Pyruvate decarboxylase n=1 Tax=Terfezia boudieri ATCC MYA-4762 TaxID=1051890 RepID=A0A3N4LF40_9PEZI|nr:pyruvate decarboxylase [Terfezia boudieri ATCC MYA-4762]